TVGDCRSHRRQRVHQLVTRGGERSGHHGGVVVGFCPFQDLSHVSPKETGLVFGPRVLGLGGRPQDVGSAAHQRGQTQNDSERVPPRGPTVIRHSGSGAT